MNLDPQDFYIKIGKEAVCSSISTFVSTFFCYTCRIGLSNISSVHSFI